MNRGGRRDGGSLMVMTLWTIAILGLLAVTIGRQLSLQIRITRYRHARAQAQALARGGVALAMERLMMDARREDRAYDSLQEPWATGSEVSGPDASGVWTVALPNAANAIAADGPSVAVRITDEERKLNVNRLEDPVVYESFLRMMGAADQIDLIADYVDADTEPRPAGLEELESSTPYRAKNAAVASVNELGIIPGLRADTLQRLAETASVSLAPEAVVNINTASRDVLIAVGLTTLADAIVAFREQGHCFTALNPEVVTENPAVPVPFDAAETEFQNARERLGVVSQSFTIVAEAAVPSPEVRVRVRAVVLRSGCGEGLPEPCVLSWTEE